MMNRRTFLCGLTLGTLSAPRAAEAQPAKKVYRVGMLSSTRAPIYEEAARQGLRERGYVEGENIVLEWRWSEGKPEQYSVLPSELVQLKVDVIVTVGNAAARGPACSPRARLVRSQLVLCRARHVSPLQHVQYLGRA